MMTRPYLGRLLPLQPMAIRSTSQRLRSQCLNSNPNSSHTPHNNHNHNSSLTLRHQGHRTQVVVMDGARPM